jgi:hypothetical protein
MKINKPSKKQHRKPSNQRLQMVNQFRQSGLSRKAFCKKRGIPLSTLNWWLRKTKPSSKPAGSIESDGLSSDSATFLEQDTCLRTAAIFGSSDYPGDQHRSGGT